PGKGGLKSQLHHHPMAFGMVINMFEKLVAGEVIRRSVGVSAEEAIPEKGLELAEVRHRSIRAKRLVHAGAPLTERVLEPNRRVTGLSNFGGVGQAARVRA